MTCKLGIRLKRTERTWPLIPLCASISSLIRDLECLYWAAAPAACASGDVTLWHLTSPCPLGISAPQEGVRRTTQSQALRVLAGTWNVNETRPSSESLHAWLGGARMGAADVVVIALQEMEMGGSSVAMDAAYAYLYKAMLVGRLTQQVAVSDSNRL